MIGPAVPELTAAVSVTIWPVPDGFGSALSVVVVAAPPIVMLPFVTCRKELAVVSDNVPP